MHSRDPFTRVVGPKQTIPRTKGLRPSLRIAKLALWLVPIFWLSISPIDFAPRAAPPGSIAPPPQGSRPWIVQNRGQLPKEVLFYSVGGPAHLWVTEDSLWYSLILENNDDEPFVGPAVALQETRLNVRLRFLQRRGSLVVQPLDRQNGTYSLYQGNEIAERAERLSIWGGLRVRGQNPGFELVIRDQNGQLGLNLLSTGEHTIPTATPLFSLEGVTWSESAPSRVGETPRRAPLDAWLGAFEIHAGGILDIPLPAADFPYLVRLDHPTGAPEYYKVRPGSDTHLAAGASAVLGAVNYGTFIGGTLWDEAETIAVDSQGRIYLGGHTQSLDFPSAAGPTALDHNVDAFIVRLNAGTDNFFTVLRGSDLQNGEEYATSIALDSSEQVIATGRTDSVDFPTTPGAYDTTFNGGIDGFVLKLNNDGTLAYSSLLGGADTDWPTSVSVDTNGAAHLTGGTWSTAFPTTVGSYDEGHNGARDIFYAQISSDGDTLLYSTFFGGSSQEQAEDIEFADDSAYLTGWTRSSDFPVHAGAFQPSLGGDFDAFAVQLEPLTSSLVVSTYLGGTDEDRGFGVAIMPTGELLVSGQTSSDSFPVSADGFDITFGGGSCGISMCPDGLVVRLSSDGSQLTYGSFVGGSGSDQAHDVAVSATGTVYLTGETESTDFPLSLKAFSRLLLGGRDVFLMTFLPGFDGLGYSSYLGGSDWETGNAIDIDPSGTIFITGKTRSADFPVSPDAYDLSLNGDYDAFAISLDLSVLTLHLLPLALHQLQ